MLKTKRLSIPMFLSFRVYGSNCKEKDKVQLKLYKTFGQQTLSKHVTVILSEFDKFNLFNSLESIFAYMTDGSLLDKIFGDGMKEEFKHKWQLVKQMVEDGKDCDGQE